MSNSYNLGLPLPLAHELIEIARKRRYSTRGLILEILENFVTSCNYEGYDTMIREYTTESKKAFFTTDLSPTFVGKSYMLFKDNLQTKVMLVLITDTEHRYEKIELKEYVQGKNNKINPKIVVETGVYTNDGEDQIKITSNEYKIDSEVVMRLYKQKICKVTNYKLFKLLLEEIEIENAGYTRPECWNEALEKVYRSIPVVNLEGMVIGGDNDYGRGYWLDYILKLAKWDLLGLHMHQLENAIYYDKHEPLLEAYNHLVEMLKTPAAVQKELIDKAIKESEAANAREKELHDEYQKALKEGSLKRL